MGYGGSPGAGHGGRGGRSWSTDARGATYGSSNAPVNPGSGGGSNLGGYGGHGGGAIWIHAARQVALNGLISASGSNNSGGNNRGGGGSGGSIYIHCSRFEGSGIARADGGSGLGEGGGGGGGRIAVWRIRDIFAGMLSVTNGTAGWGETYYGEPGTIFRGQLFPGGTVFVAR